MGPWKRGYRGKWCFLYRNNCKLDMQSAHLLGGCLDYSGPAIVWEETSGLLSLFLDFINFLLYIFLFRGEGKQRASCKTPRLITAIFFIIIYFLFSSLSLHEFHFLNWQRGSKPVAPNRIISAADNKQKRSQATAILKKKTVNSEVDILLCPV